VTDRPWIPGAAGRRFTPRNEGFVCEHCGAEVPPAPSGYRNHCNRCLHSKHVDLWPGDHKEACGGLMRPIELETRAGKGYVIVHRCVRCGRRVRNKAAPDDDPEAIIALARGDDPTPP